MLRAVQTFAAGRRVIAEGQELADTDPIVVGREQLFEPVEEEPPPRRRRKKKPHSTDGGNDAP